MYVSIIILSVGLCLFTTALVSDLEHDLRELDEDLILKKNRSQQNKAYRRLIEIAKFHSTALQLSIP